MAVPMTRHFWSALIVLGVLPAAAYPAAAEQALSEQTAQNTTAEQPPVESVDVTDLIRKWRKKDQPPVSTQPDSPASMRAIAPVIGAKPSSGVIFGVAGNIAFYRGNPATTHISSSVASITATSKKQAGIKTQTTMFGRDDRWRYEGDHRFQWTSLETFGLGTNTPEAAGEVVRFDAYRLYQSAYYRVRPHLYAGGGLHFDSHTDVRPDEGGEEQWTESAYYTYSVANDLPVDTQISAGPGIDIVWDSRDSFISPDRGWLARASYRAFFDGFLGGDSGWEKVTLDLRSYVPLSSDRRYKIAVWAFADLVVDGVAPYFDLPSTAGDAYGRSGRGYAEGRFRGERLAFVELEYRAPLMRNNLLGMVAFVNSTSISNRQSGEHLFDNFAVGGGAGLRVLLNKRSKTNLAFDVGFGKEGSRGVYLTVQEAF
jgi:outer membrane protein assembly factor BamA